MTYKELEKMVGFTLVKVDPRIEHTRWKQYPLVHYAILIAIVAFFAGFLTGVIIGG